MSVEQHTKDPRVHELEAIFPSVDAAVVAAVLEAHAGDGTPDEVYARATEDLLQLSDPEYRPEPTRQSDHVDAQTQSALDEEFARSLAIADEQHQQQRSVPYQPRSRRPHHSQIDDHSESSYGYRGGAGQQHAPSTAADGPGIEEKIEKLAEVGKQKFDLLLSRAREKYHDISEAAAQAQQQRAAQGTNTSAGPLGAKGHGDNPPQGLGYELANTLGGLWNGATAAVAARTSGGTTAPSGQQGREAPAPGWNDQAAKLTAGLGSAATGLKGWFDGARTAAMQKTSGSNEEYPSVESQGSTGRQNATGSYKRWQPTDTYEAETEPRSINVYRPHSSASSESSLPSTSDDEQPGLDARDSTPRASSHLAGGPPHLASVGAAETTGATPPGKIDLSKIGISKKRVSLLPSPEATSSTATLTGPTASSAAIAEQHATNAGKQVEEEDAEEEYTKNPFDER